MPAPDPAPITPPAPGRGRDPNPKSVLEDKLSTCSRPCPSSHASPPKGWPPALSGTGHHSPRPCPARLHSCPAPGARTCPGCALTGLRGPSGTQPPRWPPASCTEPAPSGLRRQHGSPEWSPGGAPRPRPTWAASSLLHVWRVPPSCYLTGSSQDTGSRVQRKGCLSLATEKQTRCCLIQVALSILFR